MNRYEEELYEDIPEVNPYISTNIKQLRLEARLKEKDLALAIGVEEETIKDWEKGKSIPSRIEIEKMLPHLRIGLYDIMTRDILTERNNAEKKMLKSKDRSNYNWYYGDRKKVLLDIIYLIAFPSLFLLCAFPLQGLMSTIYMFTDIYTLLGDVSPYLVAYVITSLISGILISIKLVIYYRFQFQWWHIFWISLLFIIVEIIGIIGTIPYYIYILIRLIVLKGRNHK